MATYRAIATVCQAVVKMLDDQYRSEEFKGNPLDFRVAAAPDFNETPDGGLWLFLYRVSTEASARSTPRRQDSRGERRPGPPLPLELNFLIVAFGKDAPQQHRILGWAMRALNDSAVLAPSLLNSIKGEVFAEDEAVEIVPADVPADEMFRLWQSIAPGKFHIAVPYLARRIRIEST